MLAAPEVPETTDDPRYALTWSGPCPTCGVVVTLTGGGIPEEHRPDEPHGDTPARRLGDLLPMRCICGTEFHGPVVGLTLEPFRVVADDDADDDEPGDLDDFYRSEF